MPLYLLGFCPVAAVLKGFELAPRSLAGGADACVISWFRVRSGIMCIFAPASEQRPSVHPTVGLNGDNSGAKGHFFIFWQGAVAALLDSSGAIKESILDTPPFWRPSIEDCSMRAIIVPTRDGRFRRTRSS